ncbi:hypothetical protein DIT71_14285 [Marinobacter vulgaris]|uniref:Uncharacterized protein n=1 Tax=Marinobacter vulgaris TaxID=1928331 RepID=A0A2V3ZHW3_9GAMM|nr:hypothetical protein DIT71_14285 [Marinobacter vulgaris]TSJ68669.1 hypothetical protein FPC41_14275 [Marinobacter vulgaris]
MLPAAAGRGKRFLSVFLLSHGFGGKPVQCRLFLSGLHPVLTVDRFLLDFHREHYHAVRGQAPV